MLSAEMLPQLSAGSHIRIPEPGAEVEKYVSRWSNTQVGLPAAVLTPATEDDIVTTIRFAVENGFKVIPADGTHGSFVPIGDKSVYLDLQNFRTVDLDENASTVKLGGGAITGDVVRTLSERGFFTSVPNSNAVGMIGFCLGGGSSPFNGLKGLAIDNILHIRMITATGKVVEIGPSEHIELFNVLCGAGFGFGVVTSLTLRAWRIAELQMQEDKIWTRRLIFPPPAIEAAAELFTQLQRPSPRLTATLLFVRAPPSAPKPGAPIIMLVANYLGPTAEAEQAAAATFNEAVTSKAIVADTGSTPVIAMNDAAEPLNRHGDFKENCAAWVSSVTAASIVSAFQRWVRFGEETPEAKMTSYFVIAAKSTEGMLANDVEGRKFFPRAIRSRNVFVQVTPWWNSAIAEEKARTWAAEMLKLLGAPQHDADVDGLMSGDEKVSAFAANLSQGIDLRTVWPAEKIREIRRLKGVWDPKNVFWNPVVDGV